MNQSRKSFKALSMAQPIKKEINETLVKLQAEKRKYLALERQQANLKQQVQKARRQLNEVKILQPKIRIKQNKNTQTQMSINNTDRLYLTTINKISQIKIKIDVHRKQIEKYKRLTKGINEEIKSIQQQNDSIETNLLRVQQKNQTIKNHLMEYRTLNMRNTDQFKNSFNALHRSGVKEENERRKTQMLRKSFQFEEFKNSSNLIRLTDIQQQNHSSHQAQPGTHQDIYMTNCIPLVKQRIRLLIHNNKQKIKISQNYRKFGQELESMFEVMKEYKGRDDVKFIADEFVMKEQQLKKIEQYIGKLENRLMSYRSELDKIKHSDSQLIKELSQQENLQSKINDNNYIKMQNELKEAVENMKNQQKQNTKWFQTIGKILAPLAEGEVINRMNIEKVLGIIQDKYLKEYKTPQESKQEKTHHKSLSKLPPLTIDEKDLKAAQFSELMSYQKLKDYAKEYITTKK